MPLFGDSNSGADSPRSSLDTLMSQLRLRTGAVSTSKQALPVPVKRPSPPLSKWSSPSVNDSLWAADSFMLGAGMIIFEIPTFRVVVVEETECKYWFFPKGRKDIGESLEAAALREAYEESGYHVEFLPVHTRTKAPAPPGAEHRRLEPNTEAFYLSTMAWQPKRRSDGCITPGGEYLTHWYMGYIEEDAVPEKGTGMADEQNYLAHLLEYREALRVLDGTYAFMLKYAFELVTLTYPDLTKHVYQNLPPEIPGWRRPVPNSGQTKAIENTTPESKR